MALVHILNDLAHDDFFGVITFNSNIFQWKRELVQANEANLNSAITFARNIKDNGGNSSDNFFLLKVQSSKLQNINDGPFFLPRSFQPRTSTQLFWRERRCWTHIPDRAQHPSSYFSLMEIQQQVLKHQPGYANKTFTLLYSHHFLSGLKA